MTGAVEKAIAWIKVPTPDGFDQQIQKTIIRALKPSRKTVKALKLLEEVEGRFTDMSALYGMHNVIYQNEINILRAALSGENK